MGLLLLAKKKIADFEILENVRTGNARMENTRSMQHKMLELEYGRENTRIRFGKRKIC
jgi:hypothetical protein